MSVQKILTAVVLLVWICLCMPKAANALQAAPPIPTPVPKKKLAEQRRDRLKLRLNGMEEAVKDLKEGIAEKQKQLDSMNVSPGAFDDILRVLQTKRINLMIELAGLDVRQKEVKKLVTRVSLEAKNVGEKNTNSNDELIETLQRLVEAAKANVDRVKKALDKGKSKQDQLVEAQRIQVQAKLKLADLKAEMNEAAAEQPQFANQMLIEVSLTMAERTAQLKLVNELLEEYTGQARNVISSLDRDQKEFDSFIQSLRQDKIDLRKLEAKLRMSELYDEFD